MSIKGILPFPALKNEEVAVLRIDTMTGHILDEKYVLFMRNSNQKAFSIFSNRNEAIDFIINNEHHNVEFLILDKNEHIIYPFEYIDRLN